MFGAQAHIESAGSQPSGQVQPWAIQSLKEVGIDISQNHSKSVEQLGPQFVAELNFIITLCAEEVCPILNSQAIRLHWPIDDPAQVAESQKGEAFRLARDAIKVKLEAFGNELHLI